MEECCLVIPTCPQKALTNPKLIQNLNFHKTRIGKEVPEYDEKLFPDKHSWYHPYDDKLDAF